LTGTRVDMIFGSISQLCALSEVSGSDDAGGEFVKIFVEAWYKIVNLDCSDLVAEKGL